MSITLTQDQAQEIVEQLELLHGIHPLIDLLQNKIDGNHTDDVGERLSRYQADHWELAEAVDKVFTAYIEVYDIHRAYGIERWEITDTIEIRQDTSACSCYNYDMHYLPVEWLELEGEALIAAIKKAKAEGKKF